MPCDDLFRKSKRDEFSLTVTQVPVPIPDAEANTFDVDEGPANAADKNENRLYRWVKPFRRLKILT